MDFNTAYPMVGMVPGALWLVYFYRKGRHGARSFSNIFIVFLAGCACTIPAMVVETLTRAGLIQETLVKSALVSFVFIGPIEEFFKLVAVWMAIYRKPDFREPIDGIVYAASAALGFASVENIIYLGHLGPSSFVSRAVYATPAHVMFASMWGYSLGLARFCREGEIRTVAKGFIIAALLHGAYNFLVAVHPKSAIVSLVPLMVLMAWLMNRRVQEFRRAFPFRRLGEGPLIVCPNCGVYVPESAPHCSRCGFAIPALETDAPRYCGRCRARLDPCLDVCRLCGEPVELSNICQPGP